jgi:hypothetical protein
MAKRMPDAPNGFKTVGPGAKKGVANSAGPGATIAKTFSAPAPKRGIVGKPGIKADPKFRTVGTAVPFDSNKAKTSVGGFAGGRSIGGQAGVIAKSKAKAGTPTV